jgi:hypothetical protein
MLSSKKCPYAQGGLPNPPSHPLRGDDNKWAKKAADHRHTKANEWKGGDGMHWNGMKREWALLLLLLRVGNKWADDEWGKEANGMDGMGMPKGQYRWRRGFFPAIKVFLPSAQIHHIVVVHFIVKGQFDGPNENWRGEKADDDLRC